MRWCGARGPIAQLRRARSSMQVLRMLADGVSTRRGRQSAYLHRDAVNRQLRARRGARLTAITCGGAIPDNGRLPGGARAERYLHRHAERGLCGREPGRRRVSARQLLLSHPAGRGRARAGRGRQGSAADDAVLARRGAGAQRRAVGGGLGAARADRRRAAAGRRGERSRACIAQAMRAPSACRRRRRASWWSTWRRPRRCSGSCRRSSG